jgi:uncharacterized membrane protein
MIDAFSPFPTLHPLIVHTPVVLLPLAPLILFAAWAYKSRVTEWVGTILLALGWGGALLASRVSHPHTDAMSLLAREALEIHEFWADWTQGLAAIALLALLIQHVRRLARFRQAIKMGGLLFCLAAAVSVTIAGHYGAMLTHVYKVEAEAE